MLGVVNMLQIEPTKNFQDNVVQQGLLKPITSFHAKRLLALAPSLLAFCHYLIDDDRYLEIVLPFEIRQQLSHILAQVSSKKITSDLSSSRSISIIWSTDDVLNVRPDLTADQASDVLENLYFNHDANIGINWDVISIVAEGMYPESENI